MDNYYILAVSAVTQGSPIWTSDGMCWIMIGTGATAQQATAALSTGSTQCLGVPGKLGVNNLWIRSTASTLYAAVAMVSFGQFSANTSAYYLSTSTSTSIKVMTARQYDRKIPRKTYVKSLHDYKFNPKQMRTAVVMPSAASPGIFADAAYGTSSSGGNLAVVNESGIVSNPKAKYYVPCGKYIFKNWVKSDSVYLSRPAYTLTVSTTVTLKVVNNLEYGMEVQDFGLRGIDLSDGETTMVYIGGFHIDEQRSETFSQGALAQTVQNAKSYKIFWAMDSPYISNVTIMVAGSGGYSYTHTASVASGSGEITIVSDVNITGMTMEIS